MVFPGPSFRLFYGNFPEHRLFRHEKVTVYLCMNGHRIHRNVPSCAGGIACALPMSYQGEGKPQPSPQLTLQWSNLDRNKHNQKKVPSWRRSRGPQINSAARSGETCKRYGTKVRILGKRRTPDTCPATLTYFSTAHSLTYLSLIMHHWP